MVSICSKVARSQIIEASVTAVTKLIERVEERILLESCHVQRVAVLRSSSSWSEVRGRSGVDRGRA